MVTAAALKIPIADLSRVSLTQQIWGLDWKQHLPKPLSESVRVEVRSFAEAAPIISQLFPEVYQIDGKSPFGETKGGDFKKKYYETAGDFFIFYDSAKGEKIAGMAIGTVLDWSSYNFRNIAVAPDYQQSGLYPSFFEVLCDVLGKHGVSRIEGDVAPSNRHHIHVLNKMGYMVTAMSYSERWGVLLHIAKYLDPAEEERCTKLFSMTANSDLKANQRAKKPEKP